MLSGRQTLSAIEQALADLRREETELAHRIERATRSIAALSEKMSEGFRDLAKFRMATEDAEHLGADLEGAARTARQLLERRNAGECPSFCVSLIWSMLPERSKDDDDFQRTAGRVAEGLQAA